MNTMTHDIRVMTSGAFTAAYLELIPRLELFTKKKRVTAATCIGTGGSGVVSVSDLPKSTNFDIGALCPDIPESRGHKWGQANLIDLLGPPILKPAPLA